MRAVYYNRYGSPEVLQVREVERPTPEDDSVLVRIRAASSNPYDWHFVRGIPYFMRLASGLRAPKVHGLGVDVAGEIEAVGPQVTQHRPGDKVFGMAEGAFAEYTCAPQDHLVAIPASLSFEEAAAIPMAGLTALQGLRDLGQLRPGQRVLIIGASGGVGTFAVQIAKILGAHVTGVCSTSNLKLVRSLGADEVIDYTCQDFTRGAQKYDIVFQLGGTRSAMDFRPVLTRKGRLVLSSGESDGKWMGPLDRIMKALVTTPFLSQSFLSLNTKHDRDDLHYLAGLVDSGAVKIILDRVYRLEQTAEAIRQVETGHSRGKVVVAVGEPTWD